MGLAIVVLAAGLGTRYGGLKQLAPLGPGGEAVLDYTLYDAAAAGFSEAVLVVAHETVDTVAAHLDEFVPGIAVQLVVQPVDTATRTAPWGTAHATLVGATSLTSPFAVVNADDVYGAVAIEQMAAHLRGRLESRKADGTTRCGALVGYAASATLSANGGVSRAVCHVDEHDHLISIDEHTGVRRGADNDILSDTARLAETTLVSMNLWGFDPSFIDLVRPIVDRFVAPPHARDRELRLPDVVGDLVARGELEVQVLPTTSEWLGITYPEDAAAVRERLAAFTAAGVYPSKTVSRGTNG
jgi:dTDP-glucose pyrophosphorylase